MNVILFASQTMTTRINWYDTVVIGALIFTFVLEAFLVRRERVLGWIMALQTSSMAMLFAWAFARRFYPYLDEWPYTVIRMVILLSCILVIAALIAERWRVERSQPDEFVE